MSKILSFQHVIHAKTDGRGSLHSFFTLSLGGRCVLDLQEPPATPAAFQVDVSVGPHSSEPRGRGCPPLDPRSPALPGLRRAGRSCPLSAPGGGAAPTARPARPDLSPPRRWPQPPAHCQAPWYHFPLRAAGQMGGQRLREDRSSAPGHAAGRQGGTPAEVGTQVLRRFCGSHRVPILALPLLAVILRVPQL